MPFVYKIVCKNPLITDCYVGSSYQTDCRKRKYGHKSASKREEGEKTNIPLYIKIRETGGFDNWDFLIIEDCPDIADKNALRLKEREWFERIKPTLNCVKPITVRGVLDLSSADYQRENRDTRREQYNSQAIGYREKAKEKDPEGFKKMKSQSDKKYKDSMTPEEKAEFLKKRREREGAALKVKLEAMTPQQREEYRIAYNERKKREVEARKSR